MAETDPDDDRTDDADEDAAEDTVNAIVDATPVFTGTTLPDFDALTLWNFMNDVAQNIYGYATIATRYGFADWQEVAAFLTQHETIRRKVKELRANHLSDENLQTRLRIKAGHALEHALPITARIMLDENMRPAQLEALKQHARIAGVDGLPPAVRDAMNGGPQAARFNVSIIFNDHTETISTRAPDLAHANPTPVTIEGEAG
jgi:hypothetical protein